MTAPAFPLRAVILDGLTDGYWCRRAAIEGCRDCRTSPGCPCPAHQGDGLRAEEYQAAAGIIRQAASDGDALAALARAWRGRPGRVLAVLRGGGGRTR